jgi:ribonuclease M5
MRPDIIIDALRRAGATFSDAAAAVSNCGGITKADLFEAGLTGAPDSAARRRTLLAALGLPERLSPNALLDVLNALYTKEGFARLASLHSPKS